jgi:hypothetical protein
MHLRAHPGRIDIGDEHNPIAGQYELVNNRRNSLVHPDDEAVRALGESVSHGQDPPYSGRSSAGYQREHRGEQRDGTQHDRGRHQPASRVLRRYVAIADSRRRRDRPVQAGRERKVLGGGEDRAPGEQTGGGSRQQDRDMSAVACTEDSDEELDHAAIVSHADLRISAYRWRRRPLPWHPGPGRHRRSDTVALMTTLRLDSLIKRLADSIWRHAVRG